MQAVLYAWFCLAERPKGGNLCVGVSGAGLDWEAAGSVGRRCSDSRGRVDIILCCSEMRGFGC